MHPLRRISALVAFAVVLAACGAGTQPSALGQTALVTNSASTPAITAMPTATPKPTADLAHPVGIMAVGHSGLTGEGTGAQYAADRSKSWATGDAPEIDSIYLRLVAVLPATAGHVANNAQGGAAAAALKGQAERALVAVPAPALAIIQTVDNDILCDGSNIVAVGQSVADALTAIHAASPNTKILVVGQLGRPDVTFLKALVAHDPTAARLLTWDDDCSFFDAAGTLRVHGVEKLAAVTDAYQAETARICDAEPNCATDGGLRKAWVDKIEYFSPDWAHLNELGQAAEAEITWPAVAQLLGL